MNDRIMGLRVTPQAFFGMIKHMYESDLPKEARVCGGAFDIDRNTFVLYLESETFEKVEMGDLIPVIAPTLTPGYSDD